MAVVSSSSSQVDPANAPAPVSHVLFRAGGVKLAASTAAIQTIHDELDVQALHGTCEWFMGLAVANGRLLAVSDFGRFVSGKASTGVTLQINPSVGIAGLRVDDVQGISDAPAVEQADVLSDEFADLALTNRFVPDKTGKYRVLDVAFLLQSPRFLDISG